MKHRIYSFPLKAEGKQIHTQFTEEVPWAQLAGAKPCGDKGQQQKSPSHLLFTMGNSGADQGRLACWAGQGRSGRSLVELQELRS